MPHADESSKWPKTREDIYGQMLDSLIGLVEGQRNWVCNTANCAALLWHGLRASGKAINWAGFYVVDPIDKSRLVLGPFQGQVACQTIRIGRGVCGFAFQEKATQRVNDVEKFPGHIACDSESKSEIVVPMMNQEGDVTGVIDIDCAEYDGFDEFDQTQLEKIASIITESSDWN